MTRAGSSPPRASLAGCHDAAGHEPGCPYGFARAGHLNDFDNAASRRDFDPAAGAGGNDLVSPRTVVRSHDGFHAIALHRTSVLWLSRWSSRPQTIACRTRRQPRRADEPQRQQTHVERFASAYKHELRRGLRGADSLPLAADDAAVATATARSPDRAISPLSLPREHAGAASWSTAAPAALACPPTR